MVGVKKTWTIKRNRIRQFLIQHRHIISFILEFWASKCFDKFIQNIRAKSPSKVREINKSKRKSIRRYKITFQAKEKIFSEKKIIILVDAILMIHVLEIFQCPSKLNTSCQWNYGKQREKIHIFCPFWFWAFHILDISQHQFQIKNIFL